MESFHESSNKSSPTTPIVDRKEMYEHPMPNDLYICLICGFIGCNRYEKQHALEHYKQTYHNFSMSITNKNVWDYSTDKFVHRLFSDTNSNKLIVQETDDGYDGLLDINGYEGQGHGHVVDHEYDPADCSNVSMAKNKSFTEENSFYSDLEKTPTRNKHKSKPKSDYIDIIDTVQDSQIAEIQIQCVKLLSSQLEQQRIYWQNRLKSVEMKRLQDRENLGEIYKRQLFKMENRSQKSHHDHKNYKNLSLADEFENLAIQHVDENDSDLVINQISPEYVENIDST